MTLILALVVGVLFASGTYLVLQRTLTRVILGLVVMGHGANLLLLLAGGQAGAPPLAPKEGTAALVTEPGGTLVDPLPQALALTAIVISFGTMAYLLAMAYRSFQLGQSDEVEDDLEDRRIARLQSREESS